jgi:hypothetical protein
MIKSKEDTIRVKIYKSRVLRGGFRCPETDNEYSPLWPKKYIYSEDEPVVINTGEFSRVWCCEAQKAIIDENSEIFEATGRFSWGSGDEVSMPSKYYKLNTKTVR